jgi:hypothetical protein
MSDRKYLPRIQASSTAKMSGWLRLRIHRASCCKQSMSSWILLCCRRRNLKCIGIDFSQTYAMYGWNLLCDRCENRCYYSERSHDTTTLCGGDLLSRGHWVSTRNSSLSRWFLLPSRECCACPCFPWTLRETSRVCASNKMQSRHIHFSFWIFNMHAMSFGPLMRCR